MALSTAILLGGLEVFVRATGLEQIVAGRVSARLYPAPTKGGEGLFTTRVFDPVLSWRLRPNGWLPGRIGHINSLGFVGKEIEWTKPEGTTRILTLGDSVTYGLWACGHGRFCRHNPYPSALEALLWQRSSSDAFEVIDAGVYGYSSLQGLRYYRTYLESLNADVVTAMFGWNDHGILQGFEGRELRTPVLGAVANGATHLASYRTMTGLTALALSQIASKQRARPAGYKPRVDLDDFEYNLTELVREVRSRGAQVLLITEPAGPDSELMRTGKAMPTWSLNGLKDYEALIAIHQRYNEAMRRVARLSGAPLVDADAEFERRDKSRLFDPYDLVHPNEAGHALLAELIYARLVRQGWIAIPGAGPAQRESEPARSVDGRL
jgi:lysophospholipase L1-like esterase